MVFNSVGFLIFFAAVVLVDRLALSWRARKLNLLIASLLFYSAWYPPAILLLVTMLSIGYGAALAIERAGNVRTKKQYLIAALIATFGALAFFKYAGFLWSNFVALFELIGVGAPEWQPNVFLPLGISFYTFQIVSYVIDVYRGTSRPSHSYLDFALYVGFFPQLVAGPIVRFDDLYPQLQAPKRATLEQMSEGVLMLLFGLFLKVTLGDAIFAPIVEAVYGASLNEASSGLHAASAWAGILGFAGQLYCDFAGYSLCAVGLAACLGLRLPWNFRRPYGATSFSEFWKRWHITLSTWIRDYIYYPLGGSRRGSVRTAFNLAVAFVLSGFWHGASWTFGIWGAIHGAILIGEKSLSRSSLADLYERVPAILKALLVFVVFALTLVFFRSESLAGAGELFARAFGSSPVVNPAGTVLFPWQIELCFAAVAALFLFHFIFRDRSPIEYFGSLPVPLRSCVAAAPLVLMLTTLPEKGHVFIYFQF